MSGSGVGRKREASDDVTDLLLEGISVEKDGSLLIAADMIEKITEWYVLSGKYVAEKK